jgi:hypothetical protein
MTNERMVIVPARSLDDLCLLAERAANRIQTQTVGNEPVDNLVYALRGSARELRVQSVLLPAM